MENEKDTKWLGFVEQFSIKRKTIWKLINYAWVIAIVALLIMGIAFVKGLLFPAKVTSNINQPVFNVAEGSKLDYNVFQQTEKEKEKIDIIPYVDANFGQTRSLGDWDKGEMGWEVKAGVRMEFDGMFDWLFQKHDKPRQSVEKDITQ